MPGTPRRLDHAARPAREDDYRQAAYNVVPVAVGAVLFCRSGLNAGNRLDKQK
ncbi:MAG: hypothetical protein IT318_24600 [Anaerolineales bacterium]|nr:hypothetical protein [Anaerolineales bacterium]